MLYVHGTCNNKCVIVVCVRVLIAHFGSLSKFNRSVPVYMTSPEPATISKSGSDAVSFVMLKVTLSPSGSEPLTLPTIAPVLLPSATSIATENIQKS